MSDADFSQIDQLHQTQGPAAAIDGLIRTLSERKDFHRLFDALLLKKRLAMGLPLLRPTSFDDVPEQRQQEFEDYYVEAARQVGEAFLSENNIPQAWLYLRTIREPQKVAAAIEALASDPQNCPNADELIGIALYEGAHPVKGLELMLHSRGTCNTVTAFDQQAQQFAPAQRNLAAALLVRHVHGDLTGSVRREIERKSGTILVESSLSRLIAERDWLFENDNYHIDVSHLSAVVRFARFLDAGSPELSLAIELAEYGRRLSSQFQYPGDPPFDEFYPAHVRFFQALSGENREPALAYFRERVRTEVEEQDRRLIAYVLVDLLGRIGLMDEAVELAEKHLSGLDETSGFSLSQLCRQTGRLDVLRRVARAKNDLVTYAAAVLQSGTAASQTATAASR